ncbi:hypothetical protein POM88_033244 [Heracleum sosnowskyi]|uniref:Uncharacterized protein n=1 Tax=Heracleum sosnowskyi TaxID=360622 RepID=A0AAD8I1Z2_9APIA|nr:hypothetical protein POM88_033244 [Heracleum sosnowskyi]
MEVCSSTAKFLVAIYVVKLPDPKGTEEEQLAAEKGRILVACALMAHAIFSTIALGCWERSLDRVPEVEAVGEDASLLNCLKKTWERFFPYYPNPQNPDEKLFYKKSVKHFLTPLMLVMPFVLAIICFRKSYSSPTDVRARTDAYILMVVTYAATLLTKLVEILTADPARPIPSPPANRVHEAHVYHPDAATAQQIAAAHIFRN